MGFDVLSGAHTHKARGDGMMRETAGWSVCRSVLLLPFGGWAAGIDREIDFNQAYSFSRET
jgi:hypothetical protein